MTRLIPFLFLLLYTADCFSQNYRLVQPGVIRYFTNADHYLRAARVDSVTINGTDTVLHLFRSPKGRYEESNGATVKLHPAGSWLGKTVTIQPDGTHIFDNYWGNNITIKTQFSPMDGQWLFYRENASQWYDAWISAVDTMTIGGAVDTVKEITILAKNMSNDSFGFSKLCFSKDHGFVTACDLYMFPYREPGKQYKKGNDYFTDLLCEKVNNKPGPANMFFSLSNFDNPDMLEIFNYNVGDAFATSIFYDSYYSKGNYYTTLILTKDSTNPSEIKYVTRVWGTTYNPNAPGGYLHTEGNSSLTVGLELFIDTNQLPEEWGSRRSYYYYPNDTVMCTKGLYSTEATLMMYVDNNDSAIVRAFEPNRNTYQYKLGLGLLYRYRYYGSGNTFDVHYLTGTYKHGKICNKSPYLSIQAKNKLNMSIYPNPAHDYLTIQTDAKQYKVSIINSVGQVVRTIALSKEKETLYVGDLPNGIYNLRLVDADGVVNNYKLMVHH